jgi:sulfate adenylyltransferase subunit 1
MSALDGDNVVDKSKNMPWYKGKSLLTFLNTMDIDKKNFTGDFRFPIQYVNRPNLDFRGFCGTISGGSVKVGDSVTVLPSGKTTTVKSIIDAGGITEKQREVTVKEAFASMAITITTEDEIDISRGDILVHTDNLPSISNNLKVMLVWMDEEPLKSSKEYILKIYTKETSAIVNRILFKKDVNTWEKIETKTLELNDIARVKIDLNEKEERFVEL